jgi:hypothetical protein
LPDDASSNNKDTRSLRKDVSNNATDSRKMCPLTPATSIGDFDPFLRYKKATSIKARARKKDQTTEKKQKAAKKQDSIVLKRKGGRDEQQQPRAIKSEPVCPMEDLRLYGAHIIYQ